MEILPGLLAIDIGLFHIPSRTMIISDLHLGYEEELHRGGVLIPKTQFVQLEGKIQYILKKLPCAPATVVLNGDIKHSFGHIYRQETQDLSSLVAIFRLANPQIKIIAVEGNHDPLLNSLLRPQGLESCPEYRENKILIIHGDKLPVDLDCIRTIIIGHDHPAILLRNRSKSEKYKCFLRGKYKSCFLIVQPSAQPLLHGTDVLTKPFLSPLLARSHSLEVFAVEEKSGDVLPLGLISSLQTKLSP